MKILVTGGAGFIGSHIADALIEKKYSVVIVDNLSTGKPGNIPSKAHFYKLDICNPALGEIFRKERPQIVSHHAAQMDVRKSVAEPIFDARINVLGMINVMENCRRYKVRKVLYASSGGVMYGECHTQAPQETQRPAPLSPYGITKHVAELYLHYYQKTFGLAYTALRYGNVYGPRQDPHGEAGVVAIFSKRMLGNKDVFIFGDGRQKRDYIFVGDIVRANLAALTKGDNEIFNIGTGKSESVNELFSHLKKITAYGRPPVYKPARTGELFKSSLAVSKAHRILGWQARTDFKEGLRKTAAYFREKA